MTAFVFEDFADHFAGSPMSEAAQREEFAALANFLLYLRDSARRIDPTQTALGITSRSDSVGPSNAVESGLQLTPSFEEATAKAARKP